MDDPAAAPHGKTPADTAVAEPPAAAGAPPEQQAEQHVGGNSSASSQPDALTCEPLAGAANQSIDAAAGGASDQTAIAGDRHADADAAVPIQPANASQQQQEEAVPAAATADTELDASTRPSSQQDSPAGSAELDNALHEMPSDALSEVLEELCQQQELGLAAIDAGIRRRLALIPDALRFRPGLGAGAGSAALDFSIRHGQPGLGKEQLVTLVDCVFRQGLIVRAHLLDLSGNELCWRRMLELRAVFEGLARGHAANTCLRHLLLSRCGLQPEVLSMVSWRVALMHQVATLDLSRNPALGEVDLSGNCELLDAEVGILARLLSSSPLRMLCLQHTGMSVGSLQRLCACVAAPGVSAPLRVLKLGPPAGGRLDMGFVTQHLLPMLGARNSLEALCVWGLDAVQQIALQDGWAALQGTVLDSEALKDGGTRFWIRDCPKDEELPYNHVMPAPAELSSLSDDSAQQLQDVSEDEADDIEAAQDPVDGAVADVRSVLRLNEADRRRQQRKAAAAAAGEAGGEGGQRRRTASREVVVHAAASSGGASHRSRGAVQRSQPAMDGHVAPRLPPIDRPRDRPAPYLGDRPELPRTPPAARRRQSVARQASRLWGTPPGDGGGGGTGMLGGSDSGSGSEDGTGHGSGNGSDDSDGSRGQRRRQLGRRRCRGPRLPAQDDDAQPAEDDEGALLGSPLPPGVDPQYSRQTVQAAHAAGVALRDSLQHPAECKVMLESHVNSGYWCQCPAGLAPHLPAVDSDLLFETPDRRFPASSFQYASRDSATPEWPVVLLQREEGGVGFSGGWRGFAIDMHLKVGDSVVYEVLSPRRVRAHILRAADFDTSAVLAASPSPARPRRRTFGSRNRMAPAAGSPQHPVSAAGAAGGMAATEPKRASPSPEVEYIVCNGSPSQGGSSGGSSGADDSATDSSGGSFMASDHEDEAALRRGRREVAAQLRIDSQEDADGPANLTFFGWDRLREDQPAGAHFQAATGGRRAPQTGAAAEHRRRALRQLRAERGRRSGAADHSAEFAQGGLANPVRDAAAGAARLEEADTADAADAAQRQGGQGGASVAAAAAEAISLLDDSQPRSEDEAAAAPAQLLDGSKGAGASLAASPAAASAGLARDVLRQGDCAPVRAAAQPLDGSQGSDAPGAAPRQPLDDSQLSDEPPAAVSARQPSQAHQRRTLRVLSDSDDEGAPEVAAAEAAAAGTAAPTEAPPAAAAAMAAVAAAAAAAGAAAVAWAAAPAAAVAEAGSAAQTAAVVSQRPGSEPRGDLSPAEPHSTPRKRKQEAEVAELAAAAAHGSSSFGASPGSAPGSDRENSVYNLEVAQRPAASKRQRLLPPATSNPAATPTSSARVVTVNFPMRPPDAIPATRAENTTVGCRSVPTSHLLPPPVQPVVPSAGDLVQTLHSSPAQSPRAAEQCTASAAEPLDSRRGATVMLQADAAAAAQVPGNYPAADGTPPPDAALEAAGHAAAGTTLHAGHVASGRALPLVDADVLPSPDTAGGLAMSPRAVRLHSEAVRRRRSRC